MVKAVSISVKALTALFNLQKIQLVPSTVATKVCTAAMITASTVTKTLAAAGGVLNAVIKANPIGLIISLVIGLISAGVWLYKNWDTVKAKAIELWNSFSSKFPAIANLISTQFTAAVETVKSLWNGLKTVSNGLIDFVKNIFSGEWGKAWNNVVNIFGATFDTLKTVAKSPLNAVIDLINSMIEKISSISFDIPDWVPGMGGKTFGLGIPKIPQLATDGIATQPTLALIGEGNESEAVLPLSKLDRLLESQNVNNIVNNGGENSILDSLKDLVFDGGTANNNQQQQEVQIVFNPTINLNGGSTQEVATQVNTAMQYSARQIKSEIENYFRNKSRLGYS